MKILAATNKYELLVTMTPRELATITGWRNPNRIADDLDLYSLGDREGKALDLCKEFSDAKALLDSCRGIAPALRQSAKRLERLASQVEIHEPDHSLLPKADA